MLSFNLLKELKLCVFQIAEKSLFSVFKTRKKLKCTSEFFNVTANSNSMD